MVFVVGIQNNGPLKGVHVLISRNFYGKRDLEDMIKVKMLTVRDKDIILDYPSVPCVITWVLKIKEPFLAIVREKDGCRRMTQWPFAGFDM